MTIGANAVSLDVTQIGDSIIKLALKGRLDTPGVDSVETRFVASLVPIGKHAIVDLSGVEFIASMGIRMLISVARSLKQRHAAFVLYAAQPLVQETLDHVAISEVIPVVADETAAIASVSS